MRIPIPLHGPSNKSREPRVSNTLTRNMFPVIDRSSSRILYQLGTPGLKPFSVPPTGAHRGIAKFGSLGYTVSHQTLYAIDSAGAVEAIGPIAGAGRCIFSENAGKLIITTGEQAYYYDGETLAVHPSTNLETPFSSAFIAGATIYDGDGGKFWLSRNRQPLDINGLDFANAESNPDELVRTFVKGSTIYLVGTDGIEQWWYSGEGTPPVSKIHGDPIPYGTAAKYSIASNSEKIFYLDQNRVPREIAGGVARSIGDPALGREFASYPRVDDAIGWAHTWDQDHFYGLVFPSAGKTWCRHEQSGWWIELSSGNGDRHRLGSHIKLFDKNIVADYETGELYEWDFDTFTDNGKTIQRRRDTLPVHSGLIGIEGIPLEISSLEIICASGIGTASGPGADPVMSIRWSDDNGDEWSPEVKRRLGAMGKKQESIQIDQAGSPMERMYRLEFSGPNRWSLISGFIDAEFSLL